MVEAAARTAATHCATAATAETTLRPGLQLDEDGDRDDDRRDEHELDAGAPLRAAAEQPTEHERAEQQAGLEEQRATVRRVPELRERRQLVRPRA